MHIEKNSTNPHITDTIVVSDFRNVNVAGSDLIGLMNQKKNHTTIFLTQCSQLLIFNQMRKNQVIYIKVGNTEYWTYMSCLLMSNQSPSRRKIAIYGKSTRERPYVAGLHRSKSGNGDSKTAGCSSWLIIPKKCFNFTFSPVIKIEALTILFGLCPSRG